MLQVQKPHEGVDGSVGGDVFSKPGLSRGQRAQVASCDEGGMVFFTERDLWGRRSVQRIIAGSNQDLMNLPMRVARRPPAQPGMQRKLS